MKSRWISSMLAGVAGGCLILTASDGLAQVRRYEPARPTVSPYLNLFGRQRGIAPNYFTEVRPLQQQYQFQQQQNQFNRIQQLQSREQDRVITKLETRLQEIQLNAISDPITPTGKASWFAQPGNRQTFMNTSRYYRQAGAVPR
jgi:hypothetical protein